MTTHTVNRGKLPNRELALGELIDLAHAQRACGQSDAFTATHFKLACALIALGLNDSQIAKLKGLLP